MKKVIIYTMLFALPSLSFAQSTENNLTAVKTDYLKKSKNQKTAAWILLGGGAALMTTSIIIAAPKVTSLNSESDYTTESILLVTGTAVTLGSIPLFIASKKNKKKALAMTTNIKMEKATIFEKQSFAQSSYPAIAFKINL